MVYRVPLTGAGAPYDLSGAQTVRWGQPEQPVDATAVYNPAQVPSGDQAAGTMPTSYERAAISYLDANGRTVNTVAPGGSTTTTWYDSFGNSVRTLTAGNRLRALAASPSDTPAAEAAIASRLSTVSIYSADGQELRETLAPEHDIVLNSGTVVRGRTRTVNVYDQGAPSTGGPFRLVTTSTTTARYTGAGGTVLDADARTTTTSYDWGLREPTISTVDAGGLALATRTGYDGDHRLGHLDDGTGRRRQHEHPGHPEHRLLPVRHRLRAQRMRQPPRMGQPGCRTQPGGQAASGPELPVTVTTYDMFNKGRVVTEKTSAGVLRTTTTTYDSAGRQVTVAVVGAAGTGQAVPTRRNVYDQASGQRTRTQTLDGSGNVTAEHVRVYDTLGRLTTYTDADANVATTTYDLLSRPATVNDGKATRTYTYDGGTERRGLPTSVLDVQVGTFTGSYDADGSLTAESWPNGITVATGHDEAGNEVSITYTKPGCGQPDCTLYTETVRESAHGQHRELSSSLSTQRYAYDNAGRLGTVNDTVNNACTIRTYAYNAAASRTSSRAQPRRRRRVPDRDGGRDRQLDLRHGPAPHRPHLRQPRPHHRGPPVTPAARAAGT